MIARIRKAQSEEREGGFTLIELLVVIIIIGILAAIAIPVFLNQRQKGYRAAMKSDLKNAATAMESYATDNEGSYAGTTTTILADNEGFNQTAKVLVVVDTATAGAYCLEATHTELAGETWSYDSADGIPVEAACP